MDEKNSPFKSYFRANDFPIELPLSFNPPRLRGRPTIPEGDVHERALRHAGRVQAGHELRQPDFILIHFLIYLYIVIKYICNLEITICTLNTGLPQCPSVASEVHCANFELHTLGCCVAEWVTLPFCCCDVLREVGRSQDCWALDCSRRKRLVARSHF